MFSSSCLSSLFPVALQHALVWTLCRARRKRIVWAGARCELINESWTKNSAHMLATEFSCFRNSCGRMDSFCGGMAHLCSYSAGCVAEDCGFNQHSSWCDLSLQVMSALSAQRREGVDTGAQLQSTVSGGDLLNQHRVKPYVNISSMEEGN